MRQPARKVPMGGVDSPTGRVRSLFGLVAANVVILMLITTLSVLKLLPLYPWAVLGYGGIWVGDSILVWRHFRKRTTPRTVSGRLSKFLWLAPLVFTVAFVVSAVVFIKDPSLPNASQVIIATVIAGYCWFILHRLSRWRTGSQNATGPEESASLPKAE